MCKKSPYQYSFNGDYSTEKNKIKPILDHKPRVFDKFRGYIEVESSSENSYSLQETLMIGGIIVLIMAVYISNK